MLRPECRSIVAATELIADARGRTQLSVMCCAKDVIPQRERSGKIDAQDRTFMSQADGMMDAVKFWADQKFIADRTESQVQIGVRKTLQ